jgi:hypothetical protein
MNHREFIIVRDELAAVLSSEHAKRKSRANWLAPEIRAMRDAVTSIRAARGLAPLTEDAVYKADLLAAGHSDYASKFALYCAELALGLKP